MHMVMAVVGGIPIALYLTLLKKPQLIYFQLIYLALGLQMGKNLHQGLKILEIKENL